MNIRKRDLNAPEEILAKRRALEESIYNHDQISGDRQSRGVAHDSISLTDCSKKIGISFFEMGRHFFACSQDKQQLERKVEVLQEQLQKTQKKLEDVARITVSLKERIEIMEGMNITIIPQENKEQKVMEDFVYYPPALKNYSNICFVNSYINSLLSFLDIADIQYWEEQHKKFEQENQENQENQEDRLNVDNEKKTQKIIYSLQKDLIAMWRASHQSNQREGVQENYQPDILEHHRNFLYDLHLFANLQNTEGAQLIKSICKNLQSESYLNNEKNNTSKKSFTPQFVLGDPSDLFSALEDHLFDEKMKSSFVLHREETVSVDISQQEQRQYKLPKSHFTYTESTKVSCLYDVCGQESHFETIDRVSEASMRSFSQEKASELGCPSLQDIGPLLVKIDIQYFVTPETNKFFMQTQHDGSWNIIMQHLNKGFVLDVKQVDASQDQSLKPVKKAIFKPCSVICYVNQSHYITLLCNDTGEIEIIQDDSKVLNNVMGGELKVYSKIINQLNHTMCAIEKF